MRYFSILFLFLLTHQAYGQYPTGLQWNDDDYEAIQKIPDFRGSAFSETKLTVSLKDWCPKANTQGKAGSCVGQAVGYGALTILNAKANNWVGKNKITEEAHSALYVYNQIKVKGCGDGAYIPDAFKLLKSKGDTKFRLFDIQDKDNCAKTPTSSDHNKAINYKIDSYSKLFDRYESANEKILKTRRILAAGYPVIVGMSATSDMYSLNSRNHIWKPKSANIVGGHAMVIIGYDDNNSTFEILNSWGESWGNNGYCLIGYNDYASFCKYGFYMKATPPIEPNNPSNEEETDLTGEFIFKSVGYSNGQVAFSSERTEKRGIHYNLIKKDWPIGSQFQLVAKNVSTGEYVYVFSIDASKSSFIHWPRKATLNSSYFGFNESPIVPFDGAEIIIPGKETAFTKDKEGQNILFVLYSEKELDENDFKSKVQRIASINNHVETFKSLFGSALVTVNDIQYSSTGMKVSAKSKRGYIVPVILKVD